MRIGERIQKKRKLIERLQKKKQKIIQKIDVKYADKQTTNDILSKLDTAECQLLMRQASIDACALDDYSSSEQAMKLEAYEELLFLFKSDDAIDRKKCVSIFARTKNEFPKELHKCLMTLLKMRKNTATKYEIKESLRFAEFATHEAQENSDRWRMNREKFHAQASLAETQEIEKEILEFKSKLNSARSEQEKETRANTSEISYQIMAEQDELKHLEKWKSTEAETKHFSDLRASDSRNDIKEIAERRGIQFLCHFTQTKNLKHILTDGLLSRRALNELGYSYEFNDHERHDQRWDSICLSISFPNYKVFHHFRKNTRPNEWCVILINREILWDRECQFTKTNAASREESSIIRQGAREFEDLFKGDRPTNLRDDYPTDVQAEVLLEKWIPESYITEVIFNTERNCDIKKDELSRSQLRTNHFYYSDAPFGYRKD